MALDPKAAAAAAQAAAEAAAQAAKAAADAAAAAATAESQDTAATRTTIADGSVAGLADSGSRLDTATRDILQNTGVDLGGVISEDVATANDLASDGSNLPGTSRESLISMPSIGSVGNVGMTGSLPDLGSSFQSNSGPEYGKSMISDGALAAAVGSTPFYNAGSDAGTPDAGGDDAGTKGGWIGDVGGEGWLGGQGSRTRYRFNDDTGEVEEETTGPSRTGEDTTTSGAVHKTADSTIDGGGVKDQGAWDTFWQGVKDWWNGDSSEAGAGATDGGTGGADAGGGAAGGGVGDVPPEDATFNPPPGWINPDDLDFIPDERKVGGAVAGAMGTDPDDSGDDGMTPGPGDEVINPGSEGTMYDKSVRGDARPMRAVDWVGQPAPDDDKAPLPAELGVIQPGPGPEVINPGSGDQANADVEASTAYQSTAYQGATDAGAADAAATDAMDPATGMTDPAAAIRPPGEDGIDDAATRGREFGQGQGKGKGHGRDADDGAEDDLLD